MPGLDVETVYAQGLGWLLESGFLGSLPVGDRTALLSAAEWRDLKPGEPLIAIGQGQRGVDLIVAGQAHVFAPEADGTPRLLARVGPGHVIGERALFLGGSASATVVAVGPVRTLHVTAAAFSDLLARSPALREAVQALVDVRARSVAILELMLRDQVLRQLGREDLERLVQSGRIERFTAGDRMLAAGGTATDLFLVLAGTVDVQVGDSPVVVATYGPGALLGHVALLLDVPRTAHVRAKTAVEWLRIRGSTFMELVHRHPPLQRRLYIELAGMGIDRDALTQRARTGIVVVWANRRHVGATSVAYAFAAHRRTAGPVVVVDLDGGRTAARLGLLLVDGDAHGLPVRRLQVPADWGLEVLWPRERQDAARLVEAIAARGGDDHTVIVSCGGDGPPEGPLLDRATCTVVVRWAHDTSARIAARQHTFRVEVVRVEAGVDLPLAAHRGAVRMVEDPRAMGRFWSRRASLDGLVAPGSATSRLAARLERVITGRTVGLALGGGGALGFAHIALIRALHEADVPIDLVSGVSFGAVVGALYAAGGLPLLDRLIAERRLVHWLVSSCVVTTWPITTWIERRTAGASLETTAVPFFPVALDIWTGREVVVTRGSMADGVRASSSFPGAFPALPRGMSRLVDGGIVNNVPASVAWDAGANFIIASNIIPRFPHGRAGWVRSRFDVLGRVDDLLRSVFLLMSQAGRDRATLADYVFELDVQGFNIYEVRRGKEIHDVALDQARRDVEAIQGLLEAR